MDPASRPNATGTLSSLQSAEWRNEGHDGHENDSDAEDQHHIGAGDVGYGHQPLRTSLSTSDAGSLSLHASQRLQSTPRGKAAPGTLHRVYRTPRPVTASSSATESSEAGTLGNSSVSLSSADEQEDAHGLINNKNRSDYGVRDYWKKVILDIEHSDAPTDMPKAVSLTSRRRYLAAQAPSTGSSTLVEQENEAGQASAYSLHKPTSTSVLASPRSRTSLTPPGQTSSRFAAAVTYAELEQEQPEISTSSAAERSITPQQHSYRNDAQSGALDGNVSQVSSRVHDIFQRHIHNASASYASRRLSDNTFSRTSLKTSSRPRQRLRDLLSNSETDLEHSDSERHRRRRRRPAQGPSQQEVPRSGHPSGSNEGQPQSSMIIGGNSRHESYVQQEQGDPPIRMTRAPANGRRSISRPAATPPNDMMPEWQQDEAPDRRRQGVVNTALFRERMMGSDKDEALSDQSLEGLEEDIQTLPFSAAHVGGLPAHSPQSWSRQQQDIEDADKEDSLPSLPDLPSEEEEAEKVFDAPFLQSSAAYRRSSRTAHPSKQAGTSIPNPSSPVARATPGTSRPPASPSPRRSLQSNHTLFRNESRVRSPPKTPRFPGHYTSLTPLQPPQTAPRTMSQSPPGIANATPSNIESRLNDRSLATPFVPGGYTSPFPHPRTQPQQLISDQQTHYSPKLRKSTNSTFRGRASEDGHKTGRFSSMLNRVIEDAKAEDHASSSQADNVTSGSSHKRSRAGSPSIVGSNTAPGGSPSEQTVAVAGDVSVEGRSNQADLSTATLAVAESTLQNLLLDLVKPLKRLLGGASVPQELPAPGDSPSRENDNNAATPSYNQSVGHSSDRRKRRSEQDAILRQLQQADLLDHSLVSKAEELKRTVEDMSNKFTTQVSSVLNETFARESQKRKLWFVLLVLAELAIFWALWSFANARANLLFQTTYYDPFSPALYAPTPPSHISSLYSSSSFTGTATASPTQVQSPTRGFLSYLAPYFRISSGTILTRLPGAAVIPDYDISLTPGLQTPGRDGIIFYVYHFIGIFRHMYEQLLSLSLGPTPFSHGTLGDMVKTSGSRASTISGSQLYRIPT